MLLLQSCDDVFHGSPATIFCESKLSDLRSCEVGRIGNPLNWGDGGRSSGSGRRRSRKGKNPKNGRF